MAQDQSRASRAAASRPGRTQEVFVGIEIGGKILTAGVLLVERHVTALHDRSTGRFRYAPKYLGNPAAVALDPVHLPLAEGEFRFARFGGLPSCIRDAAPDNWGRMLIRRHFLSRGIEAPLAEVDYLLASPVDRVGTLAFAAAFKGDQPDWNHLALRPEQIGDVAMLRAAVVEALKSPDGAFPASYPKELDMLLTGAGGARPKVSIKSKSGLYMVKLASPVDTVPNARLEEASIRMARAVGLQSADVVARGIDDFHYLTVKRFDVADGHRLQMVSAMSVLDADDQPFVRANWSYPMLARELDRWSADPAADKLALFRSMVLRAMLSDSDDHPRNYALVRDPALWPDRSAGGNTLGQWRLSPLFDCVVGMGRAYKASELAMEIGDLGFEISERNIVSQAGAFGLKEDAARAEMKRIEQLVLTQFETILEQCRAGAAGTELARRSIAPLDERAGQNALQMLMDRVGARTPEMTAPTPLEHFVPADTLGLEFEDLDRAGAFTGPRPG